jgi:hypothetical protein
MSERKRSSSSARRGGTRQSKSDEKLELAKQKLIELANTSPEWVSSNEIHERLRPHLSESMFGRVKKALAIPDRRARVDGKARVEWHLGRIRTPQPAPKDWRGRFYEDLDAGDVFRSRLGRTITESDNLLFTCLTLYTNQIHFNTP